MDCKKSVHLQQELPALDDRQIFLQAISGGESEMDMTLEGLSGE